MMAEGKSKDELVSVTSYEYGLNNRLEKEGLPVNIEAMVCVMAERFGN